MSNNKSKSEISQEELTEIAKTWTDAEWTQAKKTLRRLQRRIKKAEENKHWNTAKRLTYLLNNSLTMKILAQKELEQAKGDKNPDKEDKQVDSSCIQSPNSTE